LQARAPYPPPLNKSNQTSVPLSIMHKLGLTKDKVEVNLRH
jgi:hypothetical protein